MVDSIDARMINSGFVDQISSGKIAEASLTATSYIRSELKEGSFLADKIMTEQPITADQLDKDENLDMLKKVFEKEPDVGSTWVSFLGMPESRILRQESGVVYFGTIVTDNIVKNIVQLSTRDNDVRKILQDTQVKRILEQQDGRFLDTCRGIVTAAGPTQHFVTAGGMTNINFIEAMKMLPGLRLENACCLMNAKTAMEPLKWDATDIGYDPTTNHYKSGLVETSIYGMKLIVTIKDDIVKDNEVFFFAPEDYLGKFFTYKDTKTFVKAEGLYVSFYSYKTLGIAIGNTKGVCMADFSSPII